MGQESNATVHLRGRIKDHFLRPDALSKGQKDRIRKGFESSDDVQISREVSNILRDIRMIDKDLTVELHEFTPHDSCQISLIRDVLLQTWKVNKLETASTPVVAATRQKVTAR